MEDFPYKNKFLTKDLMLKRFKRLIDYKGTFVHSKNYIIHSIPSLGKFDKMYYPEKAPTILINSLDWHDYEEISDFFIEHIRLKAKRYDAIPIEEYWSQNKQRLVETYRDDLYEMREQISREYKEVGSFRPTNLCAIIELLGSTSVLDFCAGWGDRLIACLAKKIPYVGVDPNTPLHQYYQEMIEMFKSPDLLDTDYQMIDSDFQSAEVPNKFYDLVFTSPPYFTLEEYSEDVRQSINLGDWYNDFLLFSIKKAWDLLAPNGYMVIIINNVKPKTTKKKGRRFADDDDQYIGGDYVSQMISDVNKFRDSIYQGVISYADQTSQGLRSPQPMWIWQKGAKVQEDILIREKKIPNVKNLVFMGPQNQYQRMARIAKYMGSELTICCLPNKVDFMALSLGAKFIEHINPKKKGSDLYGYKIPADLIIR